jgi:hypothetical protein
MTVVEARAMAEKYIADNMKSFDDEGGYVVDEDPEETAEGWYFFYQTAKYLKSDDIDDSVVGNAPIFITKQGVCLGPQRFSKADHDAS